jgi:uncharacterized protein YraI
MTRPMTILGTALLGALLFSSSAIAATATSTVNVRNAPVNGAVVDVLRPGQQVEIDRCQSNGWCFVNKAGPDGWVSSAYLSNDDDGGYDDEEDDRPVRPSRPDVDVSVGFSVPGFSFQVGNGGFDVRPGRPGRPGRDEVCFYSRANFNGDSFCAKPGDDIARLGRWDDEISSIRIRGDARALVCERTNFKGNCVVISRDARNLGPANDEISSLRVRGR